MLGGLPRREVLFLSVFLAGATSLLLEALDAFVILT
jgi:hypothetical protein